MNQNSRTTVEHKLRNSLMEETKKTKYQRCFVNNCAADSPIIGGHEIPRSYMERLPGEHTMAVFTKYRFGRPPNELPMPQGIGDATVGYFTCRTHDAMFQEVDQLSSICTRPGERTLNLMCYRNILYNRW